MMEPNRILLAAICAGAVAAVIRFMPALAEQPQTIRVNIDDVANHIAGHINARPNQIPGTVQVPVEVAAKVCGIPLNVLAKLVDVKEGCTATETSPALEQIVQSQLTAKK